MADTPYATVLEFRQQSDSIATKYDEVIQMFLNAAAEVIDKFCNWRVPFVATDPATVRLYSGTGKAVQPVDLCTVVTLVAVKYSPQDATWTSLAASEWIPFRGDPRQPNFNDKPYTQLMLTSGGLGAFPSGQYASMPGFRPDPDSDRGRGLPTVQVTAKFGYADEVPPQVKAATIAQAHRWLKRGQASWADTLAQGDTGMLMFKKALDPDVQMMLVNSRLVRPSI